jgi:hypothetical protein
MKDDILILNCNTLINIQKKIIIIILQIYLLYALHYYNLQHKIIKTKRFDFYFSEPTNGQTK